MLTVILWGLLVLFAAGDTIAHFTRYKYGETVSASIWWLEKKFPVTRLIVFAVLSLLIVHLELRWP